MDELVFMHVHACACLSDGSCSQGGQFLRGMLVAASHSSSHVDDEVKGHRLAGICASDGAASSRLLAPALQVLCVYGRVRAARGI